MKFWVSSRQNTDIEFLLQLLDTLADPIHRETWYAPDKKIGDSLEYVADLVPSYSCRQTLQLITECLKIKKNEHKSDIAIKKASLWIKIGVNF